MSPSDDAESDLADFLIELVQRYGADTPSVLRDLATDLEWTVAALEAAHASEAHAIGGMIQPTDPRVGMGGRTWSVPG